MVPEASTGSRRLALPVAARERAARLVDLARPDAGLAREGEQQGFILAEMCQNPGEETRLGRGGADGPGVEAGQSEETGEPGRILGQKVKCLYGKGFCRFPRPP
jgi:hypothetical protein